jgi:phosphate transport system substrate-binding protein
MKHTCKFVPGFLAAMAVFGLLLVAGCQMASDQVARIKHAVPPDGVLLRGAGATFPSEIYKRWFELYQKQNPKTVVEYDAVGSGEGVRRFVGVNLDPGEQVEFGASDAAMNDADIARTKDGALMIPMTAGSVALAYNLPNFNGQLKLSRQAYIGILLGKIKQWNDPAIRRTNPEINLPNLTISTVVRSDASGTTFALTKHLDAVSPQWRSQYGAATLVNWPGNAMRAKGNEGVAAMIKRSEGAIGYVGYDFARKVGLRVAWLENQDGKFVPPLAANASAALAGTNLPENLRSFVTDPAGADSYPIVTMSWILVHRQYSNAATARALRELFAWTLSPQAQQMARDLEYVPLPAAVTEKSLAALQQVKSNDASGATIR